MDGLLVHNVARIDADNASGNGEVEWKFLANSTVQM